VREARAILRALPGKMTICRDRTVMAVLPPAERVL